MLRRVLPGGPASGGGLLMQASAARGGGSIPEPRSHCGAQMEAHLPYFHTVLIFKFSAWF